MKRNLWFGIGVVVVVVLAILLIVTQTKKKPEVMKIGVIGPFSGAVASWGEQFKRGIELALNEVPKIYQLKIKLIYEDSEADPKKAVASVQKLISANKVQFIIGPLTSAEVLSVAPIIEKSRVVLLTPTAPHKDITYAGDYVFRIYPSDEKRSFMLAEYTYRELITKNIGIIYRGDDFGSAVYYSFIQRLKELGVNEDSIYSDSYEPGTTDFRTIIAKIKAKNPSVMLIVGHSKELGFMVRQSFEIGFKPQFLSTADFENPEVLKIAGEATEGVIYGSIVFDVNSQYPLIRSFKERYQKFFKTTDVPSLVVALSYDAFRVVYDAIQRAKFGNSELIKNALYKTVKFPAVTGDITFDRNGDVTKSWGLKIVRNGKFEVLKDIY